MKIAMIGQKGIPSRAGGIEIHVGEISERLAFLGCDVEVYCRRDYCDRRFDGESYKGIIIKYTPYIRSKHLDTITHTFTSTISALLSHCDIFHYHALGPSTLAFIPRLFGKRVVCTVHGLDWQRGKWGKLASLYLKLGEYATARFSHKTINVSKNLVNYYREKYGLETGYIPNGVERPDLMKPMLIKEKYGLDKDDYILFLARLVPEKGVHYLIDAFGRIRTDKKLIIAGGASHSEKYENELRLLAGSNENIIFTGFVRDLELAELYSNAYFYVLPSDVEGLPISLLEAMSYGNCCLVSDITENTDVIGSIGYSFKKSNVRDLEQKLGMLLENKSRVLKVKGLAGQYILNKYNWDQIAVSTKHVYTAVAESGKKTSKKWRMKDDGKRQTLN
ncbi:glycosyltransferase involved in cell wall biosynthesis [Ruminiclostridium sufflavum DSM 19573]|uniref:Glycosyltransferase involved in cell wall biosynthesis n=1 Tax=Ruminiclostridium sufflavum DSM 19573 TaxID=1121337 RepID=A0A318XN94_9FIRM|nr:glycosyltransferase family 4 protein [Ruminiclostridium sufflavum]PYG89487.1 glycosyltransferase involved in cell wall biosynthesis [Ruminiclostridium sufflavum DSM 19573]